MCSCFKTSERPFCATCKGPPLVFATNQSSLYCRSLSSSPEYCASKSNLWFQLCQICCVTFAFLKTSCYDKRRWLHCVFASQCFLRDFRCVQTSCYDRKCDYLLNVASPTTKPNRNKWLSIASPQLNSTKKLPQSKSVLNERINWATQSRLLQQDWKLWQQCLELLPIRVCFSANWICGNSSRRDAPKQTKA